MTKDTWGRGIGLNRVNGMGSLPEHRDEGSPPPPSGQWIFREAIVHFVQARNTLREQVVTGSACGPVDCRNADSRRLRFPTRPPPRHPEEFSRKPGCGPQGKVIHVACDKC